MFFGELPLDETLGCRLAHSLDSSGGRIRKGTVLDEAHLVALGVAGHHHVVVARLDAGDEDEDRAAERVALALTGATDDAIGPGQPARPARTDGAPSSPDPAAPLDRLRRSSARTGRVNLFAPADGLVIPDREALLAVNRVDEGITVATLGENVRVVAGRLVATVKIIPFAVPSRHVDAVLERLADAHRAGTPPLGFAPVRPGTAALVHTTLPTLAATTIEKTSRVTRERLAARGATLVDERRCAHRGDDLAHAIGEAMRDAPSLLMIVGASAIGDRRDVVPSAIERVGGRIERFGLPVDPGNLLLVARLGGTTVLGLPGCARSPRDNGLDRVLDRVACALPLDAAWLESLAVGGLLEEIVERPSLRLGRGERVAALVLAAGRSRRAGDVNKLLYPVGGEPMVRRVVRRVAASGVDEVLVVTGHEAAAVGDALAGLDVALRHNAGHAAGMASSLVHGLGALLERDAVLVCLGDMPDVSAASIDRLLEERRTLDPAERPRSVIVPVTGGRRGNPVLVGRAFFDILLGLEGDVGARHVFRAHPDAVIEVDVGDEAILRDHDTLDELRTLDDRRP